MKIRIEINIRKLYNNLFKKRGKYIPKEKIMYSNNTVMEDKVGNYFKGIPSNKVFTLDSLGSQFEFINSGYKLNPFSKLNILIFKKEEFNIQQTKNIFEFKGNITNDSNSILNITEMYKNLDSNFLSIRELLFIVFIDNIIIGKNRNDNLFLFSLKIKDFYLRDDIMFTLYKKNRDKYIEGLQSSPRNILKLSYDTRYKVPFRTSGYSFLDSLITSYLANTMSTK